MSNRLQRALLAVLLIGGIVLALLFRDQLDVATLEAWVARAGSSAPMIFMVLYGVATVLFLPGSVLTLAGGTLFGPVWGTLYNLTGAILGAALAFLIARYLASDWIQSRIRMSADGRAELLMKGVKAESWGIAWVNWAGIRSGPSPSFCRTDRRSARAAALLARSGFGDVRVVLGRMTAWLEHSWPTERGPQQLESSQ